MCRIEAQKYWFEFTSADEQGFQEEELIVCRGCYAVIDRFFARPAAIVKLPLYHAKKRLDDFEALEAAKAIKELDPKAGKVALGEEPVVVEKKLSRKGMFDQWRKEWVHIYF